MKRYCVVLLSDKESDWDDVVVEFFWADSYEHATEQAYDANPVNYTMVACVRDPEQPLRPSLYDPH